MTEEEKKASLEKIVTYTNNGNDTYSMSSHGRLIASTIRKDMVDSSILSTRLKAFVIDGKYYKQEVSHTEITEDEAAELNKDYVSPFSSMPVIKEVSRSYIPEIPESIAKASSDETQPHNTRQPPNPIKRCCGKK